ncbi:MAG: hypothetical protein LBU65_12945 [Planctomycetaceae bacterium]|jgi:hypothetical protein|nr:hypothetical protein [Planctomycetaceae bacterium]
MATIIEEIVKAQKQYEYLAAIQKQYETPFLNMIQEQNRVLKQFDDWKKMISAPFADFNRRLSFISDLQKRFSFPSVGTHFLSPAVILRLQQEREHNRKHNALRRIIKITKKPNDIASNTDTVLRLIISIAKGVISPENTPINTALYDIIRIANRNLELKNNPQKTYYFIFVIAKNIVNKENQDLTLDTVFEPIEQAAESQITSAPSIPALMLIPDAAPPIQSANKPVKAASKPVNKPPTVNKWLYGTILKNPQTIFLTAPELIRLYNSEFKTEKTMQALIKTETWKKRFAKHKRIIKGNAERKVEKNAKAEKKAKQSSKKDNFN